MNTQQHQRIDLVNIEDEMQRAYIDYSMSVIIGRALPMRATASSPAIAASFSP